MEPGLPALLGCSLPIYLNMWGYNCTSAMLQFIRIRAADCQLHQFASTVEQCVTFCSKLYHLLVYTIEKKISMLSVWSVLKFKFNIHIGDTKQNQILYYLSEVLLNRWPMPVLLRSISKSWQIFSNLSFNGKIISSYFNIIHFWSCLSLPLSLSNIFLSLFLCNLIIADPKHSM